MTIQKFSRMKWDDRITQFLRIIRDVDEELKVPCSLSHIELQSENTYHVILFNDDIHRMDFVIFVLQEVFALEFDAAHRLMWEAHSSGSTVCERGLSRLRAECKAAQLDGYGLVSITDQDL